MRPTLDTMRSKYETSYVTTARKLTVGMIYRKTARHNWNQISKIWILDNGEVVIWHYSKRPCAQHILMSTDTVQIRQTDVDKVAEHWEYPF